MSKLLASEYLSLKYDAPHQRNANYDNDNERCRLDYDRAVEYFEREPSEYVSQGQPGYSNPISI